MEAEVRERIEERSYVVVVERFKEREEDVRGLIECEGFTQLRSGLAKEAK